MDNKNYLRTRTQQTKKKENRKNSNCFYFNILFLNGLKGNQNV